MRRATSTASSMRVRRACGRIGDLELVENLGEAPAVLGKIDRLRLGAHDRHAGVLERVRELERRLPAEGHDDTLGLLGLDDVHDVLEGQRLEVEPIARVVVGRDRLRVAVDHDRLVAQIVQRVRRVHAAVVELDALPDAVGSRAQDHRLGLVGGRDLVLLLVRLVVVRRARRELRRARVDGLEGRRHAELEPAQLSDVASLDAGQMRDLHIRETVLLGVAHRARVERIQRSVCRSRCARRHDHRAIRAEEPRVDVRELVDLLDAATAAERLGDVEDAAVSSGVARQRVELVLVEDVLAVGAEPASAVLERAHRLAERLLERAPDRHDLADRLHLGGERGVGARELLERPSRAP